MSAHDFKITIGSDGGVELQAKGLTGGSCLEVAKLFEKMVGEMKARGPAAAPGTPDESPVGMHLVAPRPQPPGTGTMGGEAA